MAFDGDYDVMESARHEKIAEDLWDASLEQVAEHLAQVMSRLMYTQDLYKYAMDQADLLSARACEMDVRQKRAKRQNWMSFSKSLDGQLKILVGSRDMLHHCAEEYYDVIQDLQGKARVVENLMLARGVDQEGVVIMVDKYMDRDRLQRTSDVTTDDEMVTDDSELTLTSEVTANADTEEDMIAEM